MNKQPRCRICKKRPPWRHKNCPPGVCKRCYHEHMWPERLAEQSGRGLEAEPTTRTMVYDGYYGDFVPVEAASFDVATTPDAVVELPWEPEVPAPRPGRRTKGGR